VVHCRFFPFDQTNSRLASFLNRFSPNNVNNSSSSTINIQACFFLSQDRSNNFSFLISDGVSLIVNGGSATRIPVELWSPELALNLEIEVSYLEQC
jgi:hypothetical protein